MTTFVETQPTPTTAVCRRCKRKSTLPELFQKTIFGRVCPGCVAKRAMRLNQWMYGLSALAILIDIVGGWLLIGRPGRIGIEILSILTISILLLICHELSHALVGRLLGGRVFGIQLGLGPLLRQQWVGNFSIGISLLPAAGMCFVGFPDKRQIRLRHAIMVAAGPLFHLLLYLLMRYVGQANPALFTLRWFDQLYFFNLFMVSSISGPFSVHIPTWAHCRVTAANS